MNTTMDGHLLYNFRTTPPLSMTYFRFMWFKVMLAHCNNPIHQKYTLYYQKKEME